MIFLKTQKHLYTIYIIAVIVNYLFLREPKLNPTISVYNLDKPNDRLEFKFHCEISIHCMFKINIQFR